MSADWDDPEVYKLCDNRGCADCEILTEALRDIERERREAEDEENERLFSGSITAQQELLRDEKDYLTRMKKLEHRRDCALEVLFKHQQLEHK